MPCFGFGHVICVSFKYMAGIRMLSSTEPISAGSVHENHQDNTEGLKSTPKHRNRPSPPSSPNQPSEEVKQEIADFISNVPQIEKVFHVTNKIGSGTFSSVYVAKLKEHQKVKAQFALKHIIPTSHPSRIENELRCLKEIGGRDNVMGVEACLRERDHVVIVMPYFQHERFQDYLQVLTMLDIQVYMKNLLMALARVHQVDIIHRDVKPSNFLYNRQLQKFSLVDFGLAQKAPTSEQSKSKTVCENASDQSTSKEIDLKPGDHKVLSPRKTRSHNLDNVPEEQSKKRKLVYEGEENLPQSPVKKRIIGENRTNQKLANDCHKTKEVSIVLQDVKTELKTVDTQKDLIINKDFKLKQRDANSLQPVPGVFKPKSKSPRRALLTKRTLAVSKPTLADRIKHPLKADSVPVRRTPVVVQRNGKSMYQSVSTNACKCFGKPMICSICLSRKSQQAPRAGTPGYRAPEVLMKYPGQTTAVDVWSAGCILLSLLSGRYPFFKANDDLTALAQIIAVFGSEEVAKGALSIGKNLISSPKRPAMDLRDLCQKLRGLGDVKASKGRNILADKMDRSWNNIPDEVFDLLRGLTNLNPFKRLTAKEALKHDFFNLVL